MSIFIDTSAFYAMLDADDTNHEKAKAVWQSILESDETLATSNYIIVETFALLKNRLGQKAVRSYQENILPIVVTAWVEQSVHSAGVAAALAVGKNGPSLVDCVSFEIIRQYGMTEIFAFDQHFIDHGFTLMNP